MSTPTQPIEVTRGGSPPGYGALPAGGLARASADLPGALLLHPIVLTAIAVLIVNDHVLKPAHPGWLTGKLSDVAGLILFPVLATAIAELVAPVVRRHASAALVVAVFLTGLTFAFMLLVPAGGDGYRWFFGLAQWPFRIAGAVLAGAPVPGIAPVRFAADPTDLITLPALLVPLTLAVLRGHPARRSISSGETCRYRSPRLERPGSGRRTGASALIRPWRPRLLRRTGVSFRPGDTSSERVLSRSR